MTTRTNTRTGAEYYLCRRREELKPGTPGRCTQPYVPRELVDGALLDYFTNVGLDVEATRRHYLARTQDEIATARALRIEAERETMRIQDRLCRVKRAFQDGHITPEDWAEQRAELLAEGNAASAAADRQRERETELESAVELRDAESEILQRLADLRASVVGEIRDAETVDAVRAALQRLFAGFVLTDTSEVWRLPILRAGLLNIARVVGEVDADAFEELAEVFADEPDLIRSLRAFGTGDLKNTEGIVRDTALMSEPVQTAGLALVPCVRREVVEGFGEDWRPVLRREPLGLTSTAEINEPTA